MEEQYRKGRRKKEKKEKREKNSNSIVMAVSNEAPFGMPLFDFGVGLDSTLW